MDSELGGVACDSRCSELSGACGEWEGWASGLSLSYTETCCQCLPGKTKGLSWDPKAISPFSYWMNGEVINQGKYLENISATLSLCLGKLRPIEVKGSVQVSAITPVLWHRLAHNSKNIQESEALYLLNKTSLSQDPLSRF